MSDTVTTRDAGLDFSPRPAPAPAAQRVLRHARLEALLLVRNGEQLLLALVIPIAVLVVGRLFPTRLGIAFSSLVPSVLALALWSTAFTAVAISSGFDRRYGVLERLASTPLGRGGLILGKAAATVAVSLGQALVLLLVGVALGWRPALDPAGLVAALATTVFAVTAFVALALALASALRAEITLAVANLIYLVGAALGGVLVPVARHGALAPVVAGLPTAALGDSLRWGLSGTAPWGSPVLPVAVSLMWAVAACLLARKVMRWTS